MVDTNALSSALGLLNHLSIDELKEVLYDDDKFDAITKDANTAVKNLNNSEREMLIASNKSLAEFNLSRAEEFQEKKMKLVAAYDELRELNTSVESKFTTLKNSASKTNSDAVLAKLQAASSEIEQVTDEISEKFLNGDIKLEEFLEQYPSQRKVMHLRKAKAEKMTELISRRMSFKSPSSVPSTTSYPHSLTSGTQNNAKSIYPSPPAFHFNTSVNSVPYPLGPTCMPTPNTFIENHF